ncbi:MAG TPA: DUF3106 domain-containing protein [Planctomycetes bacterium]|nr:DUF3106 domain-containing protein [Planctomycetota bacterium]
MVYCCRCSAVVGGHHPPLHDAGCHYSWIGLQSIGLQSPHRSLVAGRKSDLGTAGTARRPGTARRSRSATGRDLDPLPHRHRRWIRSRSGGPAAGVTRGRRRGGMMKGSTALLLLLCWLLLLGSPAIGPAQTTDESAQSSQEKRSEALERWESLSSERRLALARVHSTLQEMPAAQRKKLIQRLRQLPPHEAPKVVNRLRQFMKSSDADRKDVRQRRTALRLWDFQLSKEDRQRFRKCSTEEKKAFLDEQINLRMPQLLAALPPAERQKIESLPPHEQRLVLMGRRIHRSLSLSKHGHRVMYLARHLTLAQMNQFIETGDVDESHPQLQEAVAQLSDEMKKRIQKLLRRGRDRRFRPKGGFRPPATGGQDQRPPAPPGARGRNHPPGAADQERRPPPGAGPRRLRPGGADRRPRREMMRGASLEGAALPALKALIEVDPAPQNRTPQALEGLHRSLEDLGALDHNS